MVQVSWCPVRGTGALKLALLSSDSDLTVHEGSMFAGTLLLPALIYVAQH